MDQEQIEEVLLKRGGHSNAMRSIKQPRDDGQRLSFIYPMLLDTVINKKYGNLIRDFLTTNFMSQIKTSNVLNITTDAISADMATSSGTNHINPAEELANSMRRLGGRSTDSGESVAIANAIQQQNTHAASQQSKHEYQEKINQFQKYIVDQIKIDPQYNDTRPLVSSITVENLLNVPIVLGTKAFKVHSTILYWILFISVGQNLDLTKKSSFVKIKQMMREIPADNYLDLMYSVKPPKNVTPASGALNKFVNDIQDGVDKAIKRFENLIDEQRYATEVGVGSTYSVAITQSIADNSGLLNSLSRRANTLFASFLGNDISRLLQSVTHVIVPPTEINIAKKLDVFNSNILNSSSDTYSDIAEKINLQLKSSETDPGTGIDAAEVILQSAGNMCKDNSKIEVDRIFTQIAKLRFNLRGSTGTEDNPAQELPEFTEDLIRHSATLNNFSKILADYMTELSGNSPIIGNILKRFKYNIIHSEVRDFFEGTDPIVQFKTMASAQPPVGPRPADIKMQDASDRFTSLVGGTSAERKTVKFSKQQAQFLDNMYQAIADIAFFVYVYSFFSYFCEYLGEVHADVKPKKQDLILCRIR